MPDNPAIPVNIVEQPVVQETDNITGKADPSEQPVVDVKGNVKPVEDAEETEAAADEETTSDDDLTWMRKEIERTRKEAAQYRVQARELREKLEGSKTADEVKEIMSEFEAKLAAAERSATVAHLGRALPETLLKYVQGNTEAEIAESVAELAANLKVRNSSQGAGGLDPNAGQKTYADMTPTERAQRIPLTF